MRRVFILKSLQNLIEYIYARSYVIQVQYMKTTLKDRQKGLFHRKKTTNPFMCYFHVSSQ